MLKDRFLSVFALAFAAGIAAPFALGTETKAVSFVCLICLAAVAAGIYVWAHRRMQALVKLWVYPLIFAIGMTLGAGWLWVRSIPFADSEAYVGKQDTVEGIVTESGSSSESSYLELKVERSKAALPKGTRIRLYAKTEQAVHIGDSVGAVLRYSAASYDTQKSNRIALVANGSVTSVTEGTGVLAAVRNAFLRACDELYGVYGVTGTAQALTVRESSMLSGEVNDAYRNAGLSHLLSISGLHLNIIVTALRSLLALFGMRKRTRELSALLVIVFYCFLTGFAPPIVRSAMMLGAVVIGEITFSESDSLTMLFLALTVLLIANPFALLSLGLQLSFLSCLGILLLEPHIAEWQRNIKGRYDARFYRLRRIAASFVGSLAVTVSAVVFTFPVTMLNFGTFSYLAPLSNLVFVPLYSYALALLMLSVLVHPFLPVAASWIAYLPGQILRFSERALIALNEYGIGTFATDSLWTLVPVLFAAAAVVCMLLFFRKGIWLYLANTGAFLISLTLCALLLPQISTELLIVSAEQGYIFASADGGGTFLDLGSESSAYSLHETNASVSVYIVTQTDETALERMYKALSRERIERVYLPISALDGAKNDISLFKALANEKKCDIIEYYYTVETSDMLFSARGGSVCTANGTVVMLYGAEPVLQAEDIVLMPAYVGNLQHVLTDSLYVPLGYEDVPSNQTVHLYDGVFVFSAGEVKTD